MSDAAPTYEFTADRDRIDTRVVHGFLTVSYWASGIGFETVERSMAGSLCFGVLADGQTVAFARVISDRTTFAYLADVFVLPAHRGRGLGKRLLEGIFADARLTGLKRWLLRTLDAHELYRRFGFDEVTAPDTWMERVATVTGGARS